MLQFNKSLPTNTNAIYLDTVNTGSGYYDSLVAVFSQSYDESNGTFVVTATSIPTPYNSWLVFQNIGSLVPSPSGQYDVSIYTVSGIIDAVWNQVATSWDSFDTIWVNASEASGGLGNKIYSDRAFISGSNEVSITQYLSPNENGTYTTYNG
jgi:hypothetical protein